MEGNVGIGSMLSEVSDSLMGVLRFLNVLLVQGHNYFILNTLSIIGHF